MSQVPITTARVSQPNSEKRFGALAKGGLTERGYTTLVDRPRNVYLIKEKL